MSEAPEMVWLVWYDGWNVEDVLYTGELAQVEPSGCPYRRADLCEVDGTCGTCGYPLELVRPGKHQCRVCEAEAEIERLRGLLNCACRDCRIARRDPSVYPVRTEMILCPTCGNKRCPHATNHNNACTGSNESGQPGSEYAEFQHGRMPDDLLKRVNRASGGYLDDLEEALLWSDIIAWAEGKK